MLATTPYVASLLPRGAGGPGLGDLIRSHGLPFLSLWGGTYLLTGGAIWGVLESGLLGGADAVTILKALPFIDQVVDVDSIDPTLGNFALAITINELLEVVRLPLAVALTPAWARLLSKLLPRR